MQLCRPDPNFPANFPAYRDYLAEFDRWYAAFRPRIVKETRSRWAGTLASRLGVPMQVLASSAFRRKVFDNALMGLAGRFK